MNMTNREKREYDRCHKRFSKYGFDIRVNFVREWYLNKEEEQAQKEAEKHISNGGIFLSCISCGNMFYVTSEEIQNIRDKKAKRPELCEKCIDRVDIARVGHQGSPYKNRIVDNLGRFQLNLIGTGERRWEKGIREANRYSYEIPEYSSYDCRNEELVEWVTARAKEGLIKAEEKYNSAEGYHKQWACSSIAPFIWILEGPLSVRFINCVREYLNFPLVTEKDLGYKVKKKSKPNSEKEQATAFAKTASITQDSTKAGSHNSQRQANSLRDYFESKGLRVVDKRSSGGCFWVLGSEETIQKYTDEASRLFRVSGRFCDGGKATNYKRSWYTKDKG